MSVPGTRCSVRCRRRSSMGRVCILRLSLGRWGQYTGVRDGTVGPILRSRAMALLLNKLDLSVGALRITILSLGISPASVVDQVSEAVIVLLHCSAKFCASSNPGTYVTIQGIIGGRSQIGFRCSTPRSAPCSSPCLNSGPPNVWDIPNPQRNFSTPLTSDGGSRRR